jgi:hypothetical protein
MLVVATLLSALSPLKKALERERTRFRTEHPLIRSPEVKEILPPIPLYPHTSALEPHGPDR